MNSGTYDIGATGDYTTWNSFEAAIDATMAGDLTGQQLNENVAVSSQVNWTTDTNGYLLKITAKSGNKHNGTASTGATITPADYLTYFFLFNDAGMKNVEVSDLVINLTGVSVRGINLNLAGHTMFKIQRNIFKCDSSTGYPAIFVNASCRYLDIFNNIIYGASATVAIDINTQYAGASYLWRVCNNTVVGCSVGIQNDVSNAIPVYISSNIFQANTTDMNDLGGGWGTSAGNITEDTTSPNSLGSINLHDATSCFVDYANNNYLLDSNGTEISTIQSAGVDLSAYFTDDIIDQTRSDWYAGASEIVAAGDPEIGTGYIDVVGYTVSTYTEIAINTGYVDIVGYSTGVNIDIPINTAYIDVVGYPISTYTEIPINTAYIDVVGYPISTYTEIPINTAYIDIVGYSVTPNLDTNINVGVAYIDVVGYPISTYIEFGINTGYIDIVGYPITINIDIPINTAYTDIVGYPISTYVEFGINTGYVDIVGYPISSTGGAGQIYINPAYIDIIGYSIGAQIDYTESMDGAIMRVLYNDPEINSYVSTYRSPAIFCNSAPENVNFPYIVYYVSTDSVDSSVDIFNISINYFDYGTTGVRARAATRRIVELFDKTEIKDNNYYDTIRFYSPRINYISNTDTRAQQYNVSIMARAGRSGWMRNL